MKTTLLIIATWGVTAMIVVFGVNAGATIWFYTERAMGTEPMGAPPEPASYFVAAYSGIVVLVLSLAVSIGVTIRLLQCRSRDLAHRDT